MNNFIKVPLPEYTEEVVNLFNAAISSFEGWDGVTKVKSIKVNDKYLNLTLCKSNGEDSTKEDMENIQEILSSLGFVYEYNY
ncbi:TPA: hypothetical protein ACVO3D_003707 [Vibrio diabolicus]